MEEKYKSILDLAIEIEGIALLLEKGLTGSRDVAYENLTKKIEALHSLVKDETSLEAQEATVTAPQTPANSVNECTEEENEEREAENELVSKSAEEEQSEDADPFGVDEEEDSEINITLPAPPVAEPEHAEDKKTVGEHVSEPMEMVVLDDDFEPVEDDILEDISPERSSQGLFTFADDTTVRLEDKLASRDISQSISINDKRRFCRELFSNSEVKYRDAIDMIHAMNSYDEAEDYFYNDLCWNVDNDEVKDFMSRVQNHFRNHK